MLSRVRAFASVFSVRLTIAGLNCAARSASKDSISRRAYHTARFSMPANSRIAARYCPTVSSTTRS